MEVRAADCPLGAKCEEVKEEDGRQIMYRCPWYTQVRGKHPQTEEMIDDWACAIAWTPVLLIENTQMNIQTGAAVESFRNEMVQSNRMSLVMLQNANRPANGQGPAMKTIGD